MNPQMDVSVDFLSLAAYRCFPDNSIVAVLWGCLLLLSLLDGLSFYLKDKQVRARKGHSFALHPGIEHYSLKTLRVILY